MHRILLLLLVTLQSHQALHLPLDGQWAGGSRQAGDGGCLPRRLGGPGLAGMLGRLRGGDESPQGEEGAPQPGSAGQLLGKGNETDAGGVPHQAAVVRDQDRIAKLGEGAEIWQPMCRICLEHTPEGLFSPCLCSGSLKYVHKECLRKWRAVSVGERGFSHCAMCQYEYKLARNATLPPQTRLHLQAKALAEGECAIVSTVLCLFVAIAAEVLEYVDGLLHIQRKRLPFFKLPTSLGGAPISPVPGAQLTLEDTILKRAGYNWVGILAFDAVLTLLPVLLRGLNGGLLLVQEFLDHVMQPETERLEAIISVVVWILIYTACEVAFQHLYQYPRAFKSTIGMYGAVAATSPLLQWALQLYVINKEQPSEDDVLPYLEGKA